MPLRHIIIGNKIGFGRIIKLIRLNPQFMYRIGKGVAKSYKKCTASQIVIGTITADRTPFVVMGWPPFFEYRMGVI